MLQRLPGAALFPYTTLFRSELLPVLEDPGVDVLHLEPLEEPLERRAAHPHEAEVLAALDPGEHLAVDLVLQVQEYRRHCARSEEHTSELQSRPHLVCRLLRA